MKEPARDVEYALAWLAKNGSKAGRDGLARFAIPSDKAFGVPMKRVHVLAKELGRDHALAMALWKADRLEARLLAAYVGEPAKLTIAQMDGWCRDFDNWAVVDTACFALFDRSKHAWSRVEKWMKLGGEFQKRAGFALLWAIALHDKAAGDAPFRKALALAEREGVDDRKYVKKAVDMALRAVARRSPALAKEAASVSARLATARKLARRVGAG